MFSFVNDAFVEAEHAAISVADLAINRGYGVFDFIKTVKGKLVFVDDHLGRFYRSAAQLRLSIPYDTAALSSILFELLEKNQLDYSGVRLTLTGGSSGDGYSISEPNLIITQQVLSPVNPEMKARGINLLSFDHQRQLPKVKTIDYLMPIWLQPLLVKHNADDFLYHQDGVLTEWPRANIFIVTQDDKLITPHQNILEGITRKKVLEIAQGKYEIEERKVTLAEALTAKEAFITSTTKGILPIQTIEGHPIGNGDWEISAFLEDSLQKMY